MRHSTYIKNIILLCFTFISVPLMAIPKYDEGRLIINGIQLLQDNQDLLGYYYLPQYPRLASKEDGSLDLLCLKFIGKGTETNGGIFHALIEFSLTENDLDQLKTGLDKARPGAKILGPVPMMQAFKDGEDGVGSFKVISSILNNTDGEDAFTQSVIAEEHSPLLPNSKTAIAARLNQKGASLLWESLAGPTSDVSVSIKGYYEALVKGYNAVVTADVSAVYEHYSKVMNFQEKYNKAQLRKINDQMLNNQVLTIEVFDRSQALNIDTKDMESVLNIITDKLTELLFDAKTGWAKLPENETAVEKGQLLGRQKRGLFGRIFGGAKNMEYVSDNQFVMKKRKDIRSQKFYLNLSKSTSIKVPIHTSGNLAGVYDYLGVDERYFRVINLNDPDFQKRDVHFQIDGNYIDSFVDLINFVSVNFRKISLKGHDIVENLFFNGKDLIDGRDLKKITYPRLGVENDSWQNYEYQIVWSLKGNNSPIKDPQTEDAWIASNATAVSLAPPFKKRVIEIDTDRALLKDEGIRSANIKFLVVIGGKPMVMRNLLIREDDPENISKIAIYHDENEPVAYQISWYSSLGKVELPLEELSNDYLYLIPPSQEEFAKN